MSNSKTFEIIALPALKDNYIWVIVNDLAQRIIVIDPGSAQPVLNYLAKTHYQLAAIFVTHHHWDHTNGIAEILSAKRAPVYGAKGSPCKLITHSLANDESIQLNHFPLVHTISIPGHTLDHTAYLCEQRLFSGDTLFSAGCGRIFEGTAALMYESLQRLSQLPDETLLYCGHEYTKKNLDFALLVEPDNGEIIVYQQRVADLLITLPSTIGLEKSVNPFLRCYSSSLKAQVENYAQLSLTSELAVFQYLREWKNNY